jgi:hypothetical protein
MSSLEHNTQRQGPGIHKTGPIPEERFIVMFTKKLLTLLMSAAFVLAGIPEFGLQVDALIATGTSRGSTTQDTKEVA